MTRLTRRDLKKRQHVLGKISSEQRRKRAAMVPVSEFRILTATHSNTPCAACDGVIGRTEQIAWAPGFAYHIDCFTARS